MSVSFLAAFALLAAVAAILAPPAGSAPATARSADGLSIRYETTGKGEPAVVLVHCWSCDRRLWDDVVPRLARDRQVVTLDLAGHGESGQDRKDWTIPAFGEDVKAVVLALGLRKVVLVGHSMGGPVTLEAARLLPGRVLGLVPVDTGLDVEKTNTREEIAAYLAPFEKDYRATAERFTRQYMFTPKSDPAVVERVVAKTVSAPPQIAIACLRAAFGYDARQTLREVRVPAHAVNGDLFPTNVAANRRHFAAYDVTLMTGVGHYLMLEDPERFSELLAGAVAKLVSPSS
jgi:pimeloyl-ACP methyl ester carboxylesterase